MSSIAVLTIGSVAINNFDGLYSLNNLHSASGGEKKHQPAFFMRNKEVSELATEIQHSANLKSEQVVKRVNGGKHRGTYVCKELVYRYAMWISAKFALTVIRAFDAMMNRKTTVDERTPLRHAVNKFVSVSKHHNYSQAYDIVNTAFNVEAIEDIPLSQLPNAVHYVYDLILKLKDKPSTEIDLNQIRLLTGKTFQINAWFNRMHPLLKAIGSELSYDVRDHIASANGVATYLNKKLDKPHDIKAIEQKMALRFE